MIYKFSEWAQLRRQREQLDEARAADQRGSFAYFDQQPGDKVYFGIHDLTKYFNQHGNLPPRLSPEMLQGKLGEIDDADQANSALIVLVDQPLRSLGYNKLSDQQPKRGVKPGTVRIRKHNLEDISSWVGTGDRVWLVVDQDAIHQRGLYRAIQTYRLGLNKPQQQPQMDPNITGDEVNAARNWLTQKDSEQAAPEPNPLGIQQPQHADRQYKMYNKVQPPTLNARDSGQRSIFRDRARAKNNIFDEPADPRQFAHTEYEGEEFMETGYNWWWKGYNDNKIYSYYPE